MLTSLMPMLGHKEQQQRGTCGSLFFETSTGGAVGRFGSLFTVLTVLLMLTGALSQSYCQAPTHGPDPTYTSPNAGNMSRESMTDITGRRDPIEEARLQQMEKVELRRAMVANSATLLQLAQELKDEIGRAKPAMLTKAELKKYAEIGMLARKVKSEMKGIQGGGAGIRPMPPIVPNPDPYGPNHR